MVAAAGGVLQLRSIYARFTGEVVPEVQTPDVNQLLEITDFIGISSYAPMTPG